MNVKYHGLLIVFLFAVVVSGCTSLPDVRTEQIDNRRVQYVLVRHGSGAVVFENGLGGKIDWWAKVFPEISRDSTAFAYNRPGYGESEPASTPRDGLHVVNELRSLLQSKGLSPPYVLVGHSVGGLYVQFFARRYPEEVSALILVDTTHPAQFTGQGSPEKWPTWLRLVFGAWASAVEKAEFDAINSTGESVLGLPTVAGKPVVVLSAMKPMKERSELADDANSKRRDIARLYPGSRQVWVNSGHGIPLEKPESVIAAIREVQSLIQ